MPPRPPTGSRGLPSCRRALAPVLCALLVPGLAPAASGASGDQRLEAPASAWLHNRVLSPGEPFELVSGKSADDWGFVIEPYGWSPGLYGTIGIGDLPSASIAASPIDVLRKLDWALFLRGEIRKGRWGVLADGFYAKFSANADPGQGLYSNISAGMQQSMVTVALAYRVVTDKIFFVDVYAGGRYNYLGASASADLNAGGIDALSGKMVDTAAAYFAPSLLAKYPGLKNVPLTGLQKARAAAVRELSRRISSKLPTSAEKSAWWIDPLVGLRGQVNFTRWLFLAAQADAGGFGAGSQITWNTQATLGVNFSRHVALEAGYRYMYIDYEKNNFHSQLNMPGVFGGLVFKF